MLLLKLVAIGITTGAGLLQIILQPQTPNTQKNKNLWMQRCLVSLIILGAVVAAVLIISDDMESTKKDKVLSDLKLSTDSAASAVNSREEIAKTERAELKLEIVKLQSRLDPFISLATTRYPYESTEKALERLAKDIKVLKQQSEQLDFRTQRLAERDFYRPLKVHSKQMIVNNLKQVFGQYAKRNISVSVSVEGGHTGRQKISKELVDILKEGGVQVKGPLPVMTFSQGVLQSIIIEMNPIDEDVARTLSEVLNPFLKTVFAGEKKSFIEAGKVSITLHGEPQFDENGVVTFR